MSVGGNLSGLMHFDYNLIGLEIMVDLTSEILCLFASVHGAKVDCFYLYINGLTTEYCKRISWKVLRSFCHFLCSLAFLEQRHLIDQSMRYPKTRRAQFFSPSETHSCDVEALNLAHVMSSCLLGLPLTGTLVPHCPVWEQDRLT